MASAKFCLEKKTQQTLLNCFVYVVEARKAFVKNFLIEKDKCYLIKEKENQ